MQLPNIHYIKKKEFYSYDDENSHEIIFVNTNKESKSN